MATQTSTQTSRSTKAQPQKSPAPAKSNAIPLPSSDTRGTSDSVYGLVSVLYHALQGSQTYQQYVQDAERGGDQELSKFFQRCREEENERADAAKSLLLARLEDESEAGEDDEEEEDEDEDEDE